MKEIVVVGGGGHAKVVIGVLKKTGVYRICGYTAMEDRGTILGVGYLGDDNVLRALLADGKQRSAAIGVGAIEVENRRRSIQDMLLRLGFDLPVIVSPASAVNEEVRLGAGTFVSDGVVVNPGTVVGDCCILNTHCTVEHDCVIADHVHVAPGANLSGGVRIGQDTVIGVGANVLQYVSVAERTIVGAGATVVQDIVQPGVYVGCPARRIR